MQQPTSSTQPTVQAINIHKQFADEFILRGVDLTAYQGQVLSILGSSGAGKSTLLRCLNLLEIPDQGELFVEGEAIQLTKNKQQQTIIADNKQVQRIRTKMAMVFQQFNLWSHKTVLQNITEAPIHVLGQPADKVNQESENLLVKVGLDGHQDKYPGQLSGGQKQRVAIARALAMNPSVLLFDEPTSALDPERVYEVLQIMEQLAIEDRTMILVTHEIEFARKISDKVMFLHQGLVEEEGTSDILTSPKSTILEKFLNHQIA